jgi:hypothetical protein
MGEGGFCSCSSSTNSGKGGVVPKVSFFWT